MQLFLKTILAAAGLILGISLLIQAPFIQNELLALLVRAGGAYLNAEVSAGGVRGNPFTGITLDSLRITRKGAPVFSVERFTVRYFLPALLTRTIALTQVELYKPSLDLRKEDNDRWNIEQIVPRGDTRGQSGGGGFPFRISLRNLSVVSGRLSVADGIAARSVRSIDLSLRGKADLTGPLPSAEATLNALKLEISHPPITVTSVTGRAALENGSLSLDGITVRTASSSAVLDGTVSAHGPTSFDLRLVSPALSMNDLRAFLPQVTLEGTASARLRVSGTLDTLKIEQETTFREFVLKASGTVSPERRSADIVLSAENFRPEYILPGCTGRKIKGCPEGVVNLTAELSAREERTGAPSGELALRLNDTRLNGIVISTGTAALAVAGKTVSLTSLVLDTALGSLSLSGNGYAGWIFGSGDTALFFASGTVRSFDLSKLTNNSALASDISGVFSTSAVLPAAGSGRPASFNATVTISTSALASYTLDNAVIEGSFSRGVIAISTLSAVSDSLELQAGGTLSIAGPNDFSYSAVLNDLSVLRALVPSVRLQGNANLNGTITGSLSDPVIVSTFSCDTLRYQAFRAESLQGNAAISLAKKGFDGSASITADSVKAGPVYVEPFALSVDKTGSSASFGLEAGRDPRTRIVAAGRAEGLATHKTTVSVERFSVSRGTVSWRNSLPLRAELANGSIAVRDFDVFSGSQHVRLNGTAGAGRRMSIDFAIDRMDLSETAFLVGLPLSLRGTLRSAFRVYGDPLSPIATGYIALDSPGAGTLSFKKLEAELSYAGRALDVFLSARDSGNRAIHVSGSVPFDLPFTGKRSRGPSRGLDVAVRAERIDLAALPSLVSDVERASGSCSVNAVLYGDPRNPSVRGEARIDDGLLRLSQTGVTYTDINALFTAGGSSFTVENLSLRGGRGTAAVRGSAVLDGTVPRGMDFELSCRDFMPMDRSLFSGALDADILVRGPPEELSITGAVRVIESSFALAAEGRRPLTDIEIVEPGADGSVGVLTEREQPLARLTGPLFLDVKIDVPGNARLNVYGASVEAKGNLRIFKERNKNLSLLGTAQAVRGTVVFRGRTLTITQGTVTFVGGRRIDGILDVRAEGRISDITAIVLLTGTISKPVINLQSEPPKDESDILSYLVFGRPNASLTEYESRFLTTATAGIFGVLAGRQLRGLISRQIAPDVLQVEATGQVGVGIGKYITDRLFVRYDWRLSSENANQTILEYQINRRFRLHSQVGNDRTSGVDLFWTVDY